MIGDYPDAGHYLTATMSRRGLSARDVRRAADGEVSASAVRNYMVGQRPRPSKMVSLARALGPEDGTQLLRLFEYEQMIEDFAWVDAAEKAQVNAVVELQGPDLLKRANVKSEVHRILGETISIGGHVEWIIATLARRFAGSTKSRAGFQWEDLKIHIVSKGLKPTLQNELEAVTKYFKARNRAAHAAIITTQIGETTQMFRLYYEGDEPQAKQASPESLQEGKATVKAGHDAIQTIGRALDDEDPAALADLGTIPRAILLNR